MSSYERLGGRVAGANKVSYPSPTISKTSLAKNTTLRPPLGGTVYALFRCRAYSVSELLFTIRSASWRSWWQTLLWVGYNLLGSLMPIWGTYFLLQLHHQNFVLNDFIKHGEFALYTAAFLAPALQLVVRNIRDAKYVLGTGAVLFAVAGLVVSGIIYSGVVVGVPSPQQIDESFLFKVSIILFASSLAFAVLVTLIENQQLNPNVTKSEADDQKALNDKVSAKKPESASGVRVVPESQDERPVTPEGDLAARFTPRVDAAEPNAGVDNANG
jgi:uncharacterized membrane protein YhaH (DUF805 family)